MEETGWSAHRRHAATSSRRKRAVSSFFVTRIHVVRFHARPRSSLFSSRKEIYIYIYIKGFVPWFLDSLLEVVWTLRVRVSPLTFTFTHAHTSSLSPSSPSPSPPVLYNATIDSRPLFHARDLLQSLQPVSGDSVQCPVSLPVSVRKIYFPMRYTGWLGENSSRSISSIPSPSILLPRRHLTSRLSDGHARKQCFSTEFVILCAFVYASRKTSSKRESVESSIEGSVWIG